MEKQVLQVAEFQKAFGVKMPSRPTLLPIKRAELRQNLLQEEVDEIKKGFTDKDIVQIADGITDCMYILVGTAHEYGLADRIVMLFDEVHRSNMSKMGEDGKPIFRKDGKVLKPEHYSPPKLARIISRSFDIYKENEVLQEIAEIEKKATENIIKKIISKKLSIVDRILFYLYDRIEGRLNKRVDVNFPQTIHDKIVVDVYGKKYEI